LRRFVSKETHLQDFYQKKKEKGGQVMEDTIKNFKNLVATWLTFKHKRQN